MDQQTPGTQSETGSAPQQAYTPVHHHTPVPAPGQPDLAKRAIAVLIDGAIAAVAPAAPRSTARREQPTGRGGTPVTTGPPAPARRRRR